MDDLRHRFARLVAAFGARKRVTTDLARLAAEADALAAASDSTWLRVQARALGAAARAAAGGDPDLATIVDAAPPPIDETALVRLDQLLPGDGELAGRLAAHHAESRVPRHALRPAAERLLRLLRDRATEDLELPPGHDLELEVVERPAAAWHARLQPHPRPVRLHLNASAAWTADRLVHAISSQAYPGRHAVRLMRPRAPGWCPSPASTIDFGLAAVGREVLLGDHELAHELERIGRHVGLRWNGARIVAIRRAVDDLAPAYAAAAVGRVGDGVDARLEALGADAATVGPLLARWLDPLARASALARAAGPPLVRAWMVTTGQTNGLQRLLGERLVPAMLREEMPGAID